MVPRRLRSATARAWATTGDWSSAALAEALRGERLHLKSSDHVPEFMYTAPHGRSSSTLLPDRSERSDELAMDGFEFFSSLGSLRKHTYFTAPLSTLADGLLLPRAKGWESSIVFDPAKDDPRACQPWLQLWAATAGACTQAHFDVADNVFVQLEGTKEFLIWPPKAAGDLQIFPDAHPRARKSQRRIHHPSNGSITPEAVSVVLEPGDVLTLPAFWLHHVVSVTPCVSLNVFSESPCKLAAGEVLNHPLPLHPAWPLALRREGFAAFIHALHERLGLSAYALANRLLTTRYDPLSDHGDGADGRGGEDPFSPPTRSRTRRRRGPPPPESLDELLVAIDAEATECARGIDHLRATVFATAQLYDERWRNDGAILNLGSHQQGVGEGDAEYFDALCELTLMHACELWAVKLFGTASLEQELRGLAGALRARERA